MTFTSDTRSVYDVKKQADALKAAGGKQALFDVDSALQLKYDKLGETIESDFYGHADCYVKIKFGDDLELAAYGKDLQSKDRDFTGRLTSTPKTTSNQLDLESGDDALISVSVTIGETDKATTCDIKLNDPGLYIARRLFRESIENGGIVDTEWTSSPPTAGNNADGTNTSSAISGLKKGDKLDWDTFVLTVVKACKAAGWNKGKTCYLLGTALIEVGGYFPGVVGDGKLFVEQASGSAYEGRKDIGNIEKGDGVKFKGRGLLQVTGRGSYEKVAKVWGVPLDKVGDWLQLPDNAINHAIKALNTATPTSQPTISDPKYGLSTNSPDWRQSRRMVNGIGADIGRFVSACQAFFGTTETKINGIKVTPYDILIAKIGSNPVNPATPGTKPDVKPVDPKKPEGGKKEPEAGAKGKKDNKSPSKPEQGAAPSPTEKTSTIAPAPPTPETTKGQPITVTLGGGGVTVVYEFNHIGTETSVSPDITTIKGGSVKWNMHRTTKNNRYSNASLQQICSLICEDYGLTLEWLGLDDGGNYTHLVQNGMSDLDFMVRECKLRGLRVIENHQFPKTITIAPFRPNYKDLWIQLNEIISASWSDSAVAQPRQLIPLVDRNPRQFEKIGTEVVKTAAAVIPAGSALGNKVDLKVGDDKFEVKKTGKLGEVAKKPDVAGSKAAPVTGTATPTDTQAVLFQEGQKVALGYEGNLTLALKPQFLTIQPGDVISTQLPEPFNFDWWVGEITHTISPSNMSTKLRVGKPVNAPPDSTAPAADAAVTNTTTAVDSKGAGWGAPVDGAVNISALGQREGRLHAGNDLIPGNSDTVYASRAGVVVHVNGDCVAGNFSCGGRYGNRVDIQHNINGSAVISRYCHLASVAVKNGQQVTKGLPIGVMGNTGHSFGKHLHFEVRKSTEGHGGVGLFDPMKSPSYASKVTTRAPGGNRTNTYPAPPE